MKKHTFTWILLFTFILAQSTFFCATSGASSGNSKNGETPSTSNRPKKTVFKKRLIRKSFFKSKSTKSQQSIYTTADLIAHVNTRDKKRFVFIVPMSNSAEWVEKSLSSIFSQNYDNYHVICIDDNSIDKTITCINTCTSEWKKEDKITLIKNNADQGALASIYAAIHTCKDDDICILLHGDDWLSPNPEILSFYNKIYTDKTVWATYGQFIKYPSGKLGNCAEYNFVTARTNKFRREPFIAGHLKTFYAWLFKLIQPKSFFYRGKFIQNATDMAIMYPILELSGFHTAFISTVNYVHNTSNAISTIKYDNLPINEVSNWIRAQKPYSPLTKKPDLPLKINNYTNIHTPEKFINIGNES